MSKITWPQVVGTYKGRLSFIRTQFQFIASWLDKSAQAKPDVYKHMDALGEAIGYSQTLPATSAIVTNAQALVVPVTGTYATTATVTVADGVVTAIVLS